MLPQPKALKMAEETRYLVLDSRIIADVEKAKLTLGEVKKHPENPLFAEDKPWEPRYDNLYLTLSLIHISEPTRPY